MKETVMVSNFFIIKIAGMRKNDYLWVLVQLDGKKVGPYSQHLFSS